MSRSHKNNVAVIANLRKVVDGVAKKAYGEFCASVLDSVIRETVKDSGRAAANWNLSFFSSVIPPGLDPKDYGQTYNGGPGAVGYRDDKKNGGIAAAAVAGYKAFYYGYESAGGTVTLSNSGLISQRLGIGKPGRPPTVHLYNTVAEEAQYSENAFLTVGGATTNLAGITSRIQGRIPQIIRDMSQETRFPNTYKK
jgi:hypothetical protein